MLTVIERKNQTPISLTKKIIIISTMSWKTIQKELIISASSVVKVFIPNLTLTHILKLTYLVISLIAMCADNYYNL